MSIGVSSSGPTQQVEPQPKGADEHQPEGADETALSVQPRKRPKLMTRIFAGVGVVLAMLVPVAALVFLILHLAHVVPFTHFA